MLCVINKINTMKYPLCVLFAMLSLFASCHGNSECLMNSPCNIGNITWNDSRYSSVFINQCTVNETAREIKCSFDFATEDYRMSNVFGEVESYVSHNHFKTKEVVSYSLKYEPNVTTRFSSVPLKTSRNLGLVTGDNIKLAVKVPRSEDGKGDGNSSASGSGGASRRRLLSIIESMSDIDVDDIELINIPRTGSKDFIVNGKPVNITSVTMIVNVCNDKAQLTKQKLASRYFNSLAPTNQSTMEDMHSICSYNKLLFRPEHNVIVSNISIPCSGQYNNMVYNSTERCDTAEIYGWMNEGLNQAKKMGIDISKYKRRIMILPNRPKCPWAGLASVGCTSSCNTWINMAPKTDEIHLATLFQELAHNIGLMHSNRNMSWTSAEYGDCTDPMGCGGFRAGFPYTSMTCISGAQQFKAGWAYPIEYGNLDLEGSFEDGLPYMREIPALALSDKNTVRIKISNLAPYKTSYSSIAQEHVLYINYRVRQPMPGFDSGLSDDMDQKVYIYTFNTTVRSPPTPDPSVEAFKPTLISILNIKEGGSISSMNNIKIKRHEKVWYQSVGYGLNISLVSKDSKSAVISICRFKDGVESDYEQCTDQVDNDCDGLFDAEDPSCWSILGISAPPPYPPPPSPPRKPMKSPPPPPKPASKQSPRPPPPKPVKKKQVPPPRN